MSTKKSETSKKKSLPTIVSAMVGEGIGEDVTPDAQMTGPRLWKYLACGIDTLDAGFFVEWRNWKWLENLLSQAKARARLKKGDGTLIRIGVPEMVASPTGKPPMYQFGLATPEYRLWIAAREKPAEYPNVYVSPLASALWSKGVDKTIKKLRKDIRSMGGKTESVRISRVDLCADFHIPDGLTDNWIEHHRVSRARGIKTHRDGPDLQTFQLGRGKASIQLRIYNKSAEIAHSRKTWMRQIWSECPDSNVWRFEYQLRREVLRQFKINSPKNLKDRSAALWEYLTTNWFSLREHDSDHTTRRTCCSIWLNVQQVSGKFSGAIDVKRSKVPVNADPTRIVQQVLGYTKSYAAQREITDLKQASTVILTELRRVITPKEFAEAVRTRAIRSGIRLKEKRRRKS